MKRFILLFYVFAVLNFTAFPESDHHWSYDKQEEWHAEHGNFQSPINIEIGDVKEAKTLGEISVDYSVNPSYVIDDGHSIKVGADGNTAIINKREFNLLQFHYHSKSEHTINGEHFPVEGHFVHIAEDGRLAVIGVMYEEGEFNPEFDKILNSISKEKQKHLNLDIDYSDLLPKEKSFYHYLGSLTTPPLTENVEWYVMDHAVQISKGQIEKFEKFYSNNFRDTQNLNGRTVLYER